MTALEAFAPAFVALFVLIDPLGVAMIFLGLTAGVAQPARRGMALRGCLVALVLLVAFGAFGQDLLSTLGVGLPAFKISGGAMLFLLALEMLFDKRSERRAKTAEDAEDETEPGHDPSVFPLGVPLLAGPGAMAAMILLVSEHRGDYAAQAMIYAALVAVLAISFTLCLLAGRVERLLGPTLVNVITRVLGVLLGALSAQFMLDGLADYGLFAVRR